METVYCTYAQHAAEILEILNDVIVNTTALYDYSPRSMDSMAGWFKDKELSDFPIIGAVDSTRRILGFATYGRFRAWPAYKYTVEHSVYVHRDLRRQGIGSTLMRRLISEAREQQYHLIVGGIDASNKGSISLHEKLGFTYVGTVSEVGYKFGRWLDLAFYQLKLETPIRPVDG